MPNPPPPPPIKSLDPFSKVKFSEYLKEVIECENMTVEKFAQIIGIEIGEFEHIMKDEAIISDEIYSKMDSKLGMSDGFHKRLSKLCYWGFVQNV